MFVTIATLDRVMSAVADPTRRAIIDRLARGSARAGDIAAPFAISFPAISRHLKVLEDAGLVTRARSGREHVLSLDARPLAELAGWASRYERFWTQRLDRLEQHFTKLPKEPK